MGVIAEVSEEALLKRHRQGWVREVVRDADRLVERIREARRQGGPGTSIGFHGNVVAVWERLAEEAEATGDLLADLGSDQTSLHNPFNGGYYPVQIGFKEAQEVGRVARLHSTLDCTYKLGPNMDKSLNAQSLKKNLL